MIKLDILKKTTGNNDRVYQNCNKK